MSDDLTSLISTFHAAAPKERAEVMISIANKQASAIYNLRRSEPQWKPQTPGRIEALHKAVLFIMIKDEADIIGQNLEHHYALGFRRFFILDNASTDDTANVVSAFRTAHQDAGVFYAYDYIVGHYQALKMKTLGIFMKSYLHYEEVQPEWLFFVDADEFITCGSSEHDRSAQIFNHLLNDASKNLLVFHWVQCASERVVQTISREASLFDAFPHTWPRMKAEVPKIAYRIGMDLEPIQGNHNVTSFPYNLSTIAVMADANFYIFHFPNRTVDQLRKKVINANIALSATPDRDGLGGTASHWRTYFNWYSMHGDVALEHILSDHIKGCTTA